MANALEYIAHYLDRIDDHLEVIATEARDSSSGQTKIAQALVGVQQLLGRIATKP